eukprot:5386136-Pyramimonas_sp.AAC.1
MLALLFLGCAQRSALLVHRENIPTLPVRDWSTVRIYPREASYYDELVGKQRGVSAYIKYE